MIFLNLRKQKTIPEQQDHKMEIEWLVNAPSEFLLFARGLLVLSG